MFEQIIDVIIDIGLNWACNDSVSGCVGECDFVIVEVMVLSLIVLEDVCGGVGPLHGWSAKSAGGETRTLSRAGEGGESCVVQALGGSTTSLLVAASPISGPPLSYTGWFQALT